MFARRNRTFAAISVPAILTALACAGVAIAATPRISAERDFDTGGKGAAVDTSRQPIRMAVSVVCGKGNRSCAAEIYTVPEQRRLELRSISCDFAVRAPGRVEDGAVLFSRYAKGDFGPVLPVRTGESDGVLKYGFSLTARVVGMTGAKLVVGVNTDNDVSDMICRFAGDLVAAE